MGKVTDITAQKRNKSRVSIFIDGEFVCGLDAVALASARVKIGDEITPDRLVELTRKSELNSAFERASDYLSYSPRTEKQIYRYLCDKGYDRTVAAETVQKLKGYGYIDDRAYAELYIRSKSKHYGNYRLAAELKQKGVAPDIISELLDGADESEIISVAQKYLRSHRSGDRQKLKRFLASRGFGWDSINGAVSELEKSGELADGNGEA